MSNKTLNPRQLAALDKINATAAELGATLHRYPACGHFRNLKVVYALHSSPMRPASWRECDLGSAVVYGEYRWGNSGNARCGLTALLESIQSRISDGNEYQPKKTNQQGASQ